MKRLLGSVTVVVVMAAVLAACGNSGSKNDQAKKAAAMVPSTALAYVDVAVTRWQNFTGKQATLDGDGRSFEEIQAQRVGVAA